MFENDHKVSFNMASEASYFSFLVQKVNWAIWRSTWSLGQTVLQKLVENSIETFWEIFKQCVAVGGGGGGLGEALGKVFTGRS